MREETRENLRASAAHLFVAKGFGAVTIDEITERAGYSRGAFYSNYADKRELLEELIDTGFDSDIAAVATMPGTGNEAELSQTFARIADQFAGTASNATWMLEFQLACVREPGLSKRYLAQFNKLRGAVVGVIDAHQEALSHDKLPDNTSAVHADAFIALLSGMALLWTLEPARYTEGDIAHVFRSLLHGLQATPNDR